jgi:drug/metabolite transporter (DMT)-like permease
MWLLAAIGSYFLNAGINVADKFLLSQKVHSSIAYAFYVGIWSILNAVILIFNPWMPNIWELFIDLSAGLLFLATLIFWYKALHQSEATRVVPIVGALVPIFSLLLAAVFLNEDITDKQMISFFILIFGGVLISVKRTKFYLLRQVIERIKEVTGNILGKVHAGYRPNRRTFINSTLSALFFASFYILMKYIYLHQPFIGGFVWSRFGSFLGALLILTVPSWRALIKRQGGAAKNPGNVSFFLVVRLIASLSFIIFNWALSLGNVALINALQGTQYLFLIILVLAVSSKYPKILREELDKAIMVQKLIGVFLVGMGLYVLVS